MQANEVPDKLYFSATENGTHYYTEGIPFEREYIEYTRTDTLIEKACVAFCKVRCQGNPPRSTCTSLGTCKEYDDFRKAMREESV